LVGVLSYVPGKCTTVIVVNWAEIGRSMKDRKFCNQSSLFRSLCIDRHFYYCILCLILAALLALNLGSEKVSGSSGGRIFKARGPDYRTQKGAFTADSPPDIAILFPNLIVK
jgi:hypothetical protein